MKGSLRGRLLAGGATWGLGALLAATAISLIVFRTHLDHSGEPALHAAVNPASIAVTGSVAATLLITGIAMMVAAVRPLENLRGALGRVRSGASAEVTGQYPAEIQPLVDELNLLLTENGEIVRRARTEAGNLAHGLKTPLAVMANEELSPEMRAQLDGMHRTISAHLARARATVATGVAEHCDARRSIERLARAMRTIYPTRKIDVDVVGAIVVHGNASDFEEMTGNLFDNACRCASSSVSVTARHVGSECVIEIIDDGPGMNEESMRSALQWGEKGFGIAISRELAEAAGGTLTLEAPGGLRATLRLPARDA